MRSESNVTPLTRRARVTSRSTWRVGLGIKTTARDAKSWVDVTVESYEGEPAPAKERAKDIAAEIAAANRLAVVDRLVYEVVSRRVEYA